MDYYKIKGLPPEKPPLLEEEKEEAGAVKEREGAPAAPVVTTNKPIVGGILLLISGMLAIIECLRGLIFRSEVAAEIHAKFNETAEISLSTIESLVLACIIIFIIFGILAVLGGVLALRRKLWGLAVVGGVFALLSGGPWFISSVLGLIGLILIALSKGEFEPRGMGASGGSNWGKGTS